MRYFILVEKKIEKHEIKEGKNAEENLQILKMIGPKK